MILILKDFMKKNKKISILYIFTSLVSIFTDSLFVVAVESINASNFFKDSFLYILLYFLFFIIRLYDDSILKMNIENTLLNYLKSEVAKVVVSSPCDGFGSNLHTLHDKQLSKISEYSISIYSTIIRILSFILLNITIIININSTLSIVIILTFLITILSTIISRNVKRVSKVYLEDQRHNYEVQANIISNKDVIANLDSESFIFGEFQKSLEEEANNYSKIQRIRAKNKRLSEANYILSNVVLPVFALIISFIGKGDIVTILPILITITPRISSTTNIISTCILQSREVAPLINRYYDLKSPKPLRLTQGLSSILNINGNIPFVNKHIDIKINKNGLYSINGDSGSGKTTLLKCIAGLVSSSDLTVNTSDLLVEYFDIKPFYVKNKVIDNLMMVSEKEGKDIINIIDYLSKKTEVDISIRVEEKSLSDYGNFSDGQKKIINLCHILLSEANLILLDEPTANLDKKTREVVIDIIKDLSHSKIVILTTHDLELKLKSKELINL